MPPHRVGFLRRFGLKTSIYFACFGLESGMVFEGITGVYECNYLSFQFQMNENEVEIYEFEIYAFEEFFVCTLNLSMMM